MDLVPVAKPWGWYVTMYQSRDYWTKFLKVNPGESLSLQMHEHRTEYWIPLDDGLGAVINGQPVYLVVGRRYDVMQGALHRITNHGKVGASLIEVATGRPDENDIIRMQDNYGR